VNTETTLRVVLADDHHIFREGLRAMLTSENIEVVGEAADGEQAVALVLEQHPDVVVLDLGMPGTPGLAALREILQADPTVHVVVLTVSAEDSDVLAALSGGACSYLLKDMRHEELAAAIRLAAAGHAVLSREVARSVAGEVRSGKARSGGSGEKAVALTPRELDVIRLLALGTDNAGIGRELSISRHTVKQYVTTICKKIGVHGRVQAAVYAVRHDLV
jgi:DNA-binding NarL/FixJ family response regulator